MSKEKSKKGSDLDDVEFTGAAVVVDDIADAPEASQPESSSSSASSKSLFSIIISIMLVVTGSCNTLAAKWADSIDITNKTSWYIIDQNDDKSYKYGTVNYKAEFAHPFFQLKQLLTMLVEFQATVMFVGEMTCMVAYFISLLIQRHQWRKKHLGISPSDIRKSRFPTTSDSQSAITQISQYPRPPRMNYFLFAAPAFCDVVATSIQYLGLNLTSASSYQMLRGAVIIFTGLMSLFFLKTRLQAFRWIGMIVVVAGLAVVGVADILLTDETEDTSTGEIILGDILIIVAQIVVAAQMVVEQKILSGADVPALLAVGFEGIFGFIILTILMIPMYYIKVPSSFSKLPERRLEDALNAFWMMSVSGELVASLFTTVVSIAFFNFAGVTVTKCMSATTRMVLDSVRTIIIWAVSIPLFDSQFIPEQVMLMHYLSLIVNHSFSYT
uniref:CRT-like domain-containing protein n=1 Tax=Syphacia muris TaxID=451379 RepID=A0A0N5ADW1_9BILA